ncbi:TPA: GNAT family N-acetyltransferase [Proteus mirabilis]|nr:GNAT family N-acetyltransferase [Proteus mirabilis]HDS8302150.1 GNAT family N-acetyltransferase [Proteus mirabilis]
MGGIYTNNYNNPSVKLSNSDIRIEYDEYKNLGIGTIIFNYIITWAKQFENTRVETIKLSDVDRDNKNRRNHFYEKFGIIFNYQDEKLTGDSIFELNTSDLRVADIDGGLNKLEFINKYRYELSENDSLMSKLECD